MQYAIVAMLVNGKTIGVALIGTSLADLMLGFKQVSGTDVTLLAAQ